MNNNDLSPLSLAVVLATWAFGSRLAPIIGAYGVILFGWLGGVMFGALRLPVKDRSVRWRLLALVLGSLVLTLAVTVPIATALAAYSGDPSLKTDHLLMLVAIAIPAIGHSWLAIGSWAARCARRALEAVLPAEKQ